MIQTKREDCRTPPGGVYLITAWDDETGNAEILEYDAEDQLICRREWGIFPEAEGPRPDGIAGEMRTFDPSGNQMDTRPIGRRQRSSAGPAAS